MDFNAIDKEKPVLKIGEKLCGGCWAVSVEAVGWVWMNFAHLEPSWLCIECRKKHGSDLEKMQEHGL